MGLPWHSAPWYSFIGQFGSVSQPVSLYESLITMIDGFLVGVGVGVRVAVGVRVGVGVGVRVGVGVGVGVRVGVGVGVRVGVGVGVSVGWVCSHE